MVLKDRFVSQPCPRNQWASLLLLFKQFVVVSFPWGTKPSSQGCWVCHSVEAVALGAGQHRIWDRLPISLLLLLSSECLGTSSKLEKWGQQSHGYGLRNWEEELTFQLLVSLNETEQVFRMLWAILARFMSCHCLSHVLGLFFTVTRCCEMVQADSEAGWRSDPISVCGARQGPEGCTAGMLGWCPACPSPSAVPQWCA